MSAALLEWVQMRTLLSFDFLKTSKHAMFNVNVFPVPNGPMRSSGGAGLGSRIMVMALCWLSFGFLTMYQVEIDFYQRK